MSRDYVAHRLVVGFGTAADRLRDRVKLDEVE